MTDGLEVRADDGVLRLTLARPERSNALTAELTDRLTEEVEGAAAREEVRVVLLTGAGSAFCAGADVSGPDPHERLDVTSLDRANRLVRAVVSLDRPVVAAANGVAAGFGCSLAVACDLVVASASARFLLAFSRIGLMPDGGATATVAAAVGRTRAMRMALLGKPLSAQEAYDYASSRTAESFESEGQLATEHSEIRGDIAGGFEVSRLTARVTVSPEVAALQQRAEDLEEQVAALRLRREELGDDYLPQLQALLVELAEVQEQIDAASAAR